MNLIQFSSYSRLISCDENYAL